MNRKERRKAGIKTKVPSFRLENKYVGFDDMIAAIKEETGLVITDYIKF